MKKAIFFCDILGTLTDGSENDYQDLIYNLEELKKKNRIDILYFSLVSSDSIDYVLEFYKKLHPYLINSSLSVGPMFSSGVVFINNEYKQCETCKTDQIIHFVSKNHFDKVYFADDTYMYHAIINKSLEHYPEVDLQSFILGNDGSAITPHFSKEKGIGELNSILEYFNILPTPFRRKRMYKSI